MDASRNQQGLATLRTGMKVNHLIHCERTQHSAEALITTNNSAVAPTQHSAETASAPYYTDIESLERMTYMHSQS